MKYFASLLIIVTVAYANDDFVPRTRSDIALSFRTCLTTLRISQETFNTTNWNLRADNEIVRSMVKCMIQDFGIFDEITGFNMDHLVIQLGGDTIRARAEKCVTNNRSGDAVGKWVQRVMNCLEDENLKLYKE